MATNTAIGNSIGIPFKRTKLHEKPYIEPDVLASLCGVWIADQNTNESPNRNIIKNKLKDRGGDFEILNAAYKLNSGYGKYAADFTSWSKAPNNKLDFKDYYFKITSASDFNSYGYVIWRTAAIDGFKIKVSGFPKGKKLIYTTFNEAGQQQTIIDKDGVYKLPASIDNTSIGFGFSIANQSPDDFIGLKVEQIPYHKGAFVTDGVNDLIASQKTTPEMLSNGNEITVVTMSVNLQQVGGRRINFLSSISSYLENILATTAIDKHSISGYTSTNYDISENHLNIPFILGDIEDYTLNKANDSSTRGFNRFGVNGYVTSNTYRSANIAWYWTIIANKVLTEDQINQVIEYFNLDKYVKPDIIYNVKKQGITNDNHAEFGDKLIDYSGNGHDMQLYNIGWSVESGIGGYREDFTTWYTPDKIPTVELTPTKIVLDRRANALYLGTMYDDSINAMTVKVSGLSSKNYIDYVYFVDGTKDRLSIRMGTDGIYNLPYSDYHRTGSLIIGFFITILSDNRVTIEQIPEYENALVLDGVNDYGKVTNLPIYKDYTVVADREILQTGKSGCSISKNNPGAFLFELGAATSSSNTMEEYSFGMVTPLTVTNERQFSYQSKYLYNGEIISVGTDNDTKDMWLGTVRDNDPRFSNLAFYAAMLFPYSLSKFLIERQLKKHKLGTMYEDMVRFLPIINSKEYIDVSYYVKDSDTPLNIGDYIPIGYGFDIVINLKPKTAIEDIFYNGVSQWFEERDETKEYVKYIITIDSIIEYPQKIDIVTYKYIKPCDIPMPFPVFVNYEDLNGNLIEFTDYNKFNVNTLVKVYDAVNLLPDLYNINNYAIRYEGRTIVFTSIDNIKNQWFKIGLIQGFTSAPRYKLDGNAPKCILSPETLKLDNYIYEYLGYIPDISGNRNHGFIYNSGFNIMDSGADVYGIIQLDGVDDFIRIKNLPIGGRQMFMKFSYDGNGSLAYDQRKRVTDNFAMFVGDNRIAHNFRNSGDTYINGILNKHILSSDLKNVVHNATLTNDVDIDVVSIIPTIGSNIQGLNYYTKMSLYTFMLFDEISTPEKIRELNEIIGINPMIDVPPYYYDAHGKTNQDTDKAQLVNLGNGGEHTLNINNVAYEGESGYKDNALLLDGVDDTLRNATIPALTNFTCVVKREMIGEQINGSSFMNKGQNPTTGGTKNAFMYDYKTASGKYIYSFSNANKVDTANLISYITPISADGQNITKGTGGDDVGLMIGKWDTYWKGVFYKLMLYPKTLDLLQIRMLKNLFELDEKIDVNSSMFIRPLQIIDYFNPHEELQYTISGGGSIITINGWKGSNIEPMLQIINFDVKTFKINLINNYGTVLKYEYKDGFSYEKRNLIFSNDYELYNNGIADDIGLFHELQINEQDAYIIQLLSVY